MAIIQIAVCFLEMSASFNLTKAKFILRGLEIYDLLLCRESFAPSLNIN